MARKNYSKFSKNKENEEVVEEAVNNELVVETEETVQEEFDKVIEEIVTEETPVKKEVGVVTGCAKLNVRKEAKPGSEVLCVIDKDSEVEVLSTAKDFYEVCTSSGVVGFCMKQYIKVK